MKQENASKNSADIGGFPSEFFWLHLKKIQQNNRRPTSTDEEPRNLPAKNPSLRFLKMTALEPLFSNEPPILLLSKQNIQPITNIWQNRFEDSHPFQSSWPTLHWETLEQTSSDVFEMSWALVWWWKAWLVAAYWILLGLNAVPNTRSFPGTRVLSRTLTDLPPEWLWYWPWALFWICNSSPNWFLSQTSSLLRDSWSFPGFWRLS